MLITILFSCKKDNNIIPKNSLNGKEFTFALVSSQEECDVLISRGVNCAQEIIFLDNTKATVVVTDIMNSGNYSINKNRLTVNLEPGSDAENPMIFIINNDFTEITRISDNSNDVWKLKVKGVSPWDL